MRTGQRQEAVGPEETGRGEGQEPKATAATTALRSASQAPIGRRFGDLLVSDGVVTQKQFDLALTEQRRTGEKLGEIMVRLGLITEDQLVHFLSRQFGIPEVAFPKKIAADIIKLIPARIARKYCSTEKLKSKGLGGRPIGKLTKVLFGLIKEKDIPPCRKLNVYS